MIILKGKFVGDFFNNGENGLRVKFLTKMGGWDGAEKKSINEPHEFTINILNSSLADNIRESLKDEKKKATIFHSKPVIFGDLVQLDGKHEVNVRSQQGIHFGEFCYNMDLVRTTRDFECKYYESGSMSAFSSCAYDIYDPNAEKQRRSFFLNVKALGGLGEMIAEKVLKGQQTFLGGYMDLNRYKSSSGDIITGFNWNIDSMKFVGSSAKGSQQANIGLDDDDSGHPVEPQSVQKDTKQSSPLTADDLIGDDECPF